MISLEKLYILTPLQKMPKNVGDLGKFIVAKGFKKLPKVQKSPNLVTLFVLTNCMLQSMQRMSENLEFQRSFDCEVEIS